MTNAAVQKEALPLAGGLTPVNVQTLAKLSMLSLTKPDMGTAPVISGQLRVSFRPAQTLRNSFGVSRSLPGSLTYRPSFDYRETREKTNWMILFNSGESTESANPLISSKTCVAGRRAIKHDYCSCSLKPENYSGSTEHNHYLGSLVIRCGCTYVNQQPIGKEKGSTANAALEMVPFLNHEGNQEHPALENGYFFSHQENKHRRSMYSARKPTLAYLTNHEVAKLQDNQPSLRGSARHLCIAKRYAQNLLSLSESVNSLTRSKPVQPFGSTPRDFSQTERNKSCSLLPHTEAEEEHDLKIMSAIIITANPKTIFFIAHPFGSMPRDCNSLRMILLIQADTEASPSCANACLMPSSKPGSTRKAICLLPLPLISMVDIWLTPDYFEMATKCMTGAYQKATPRTVRAVPRRLTTNDRISIEAAMKEHTQTHPKYQYRFRFLALCATGSAIIHITAPDEHAAREMSPTGFVMVFTARLPVEVRHA